MADDGIYSIRFGRAFRERMEKKAKRRRQSVAGYLKDLVEADLAKDEHQEEAVSKAALEAFDRFAGGSSFDPVTKEEIDRVVEPIPLTEEERKVLERFVGGMKKKRRRKYSLTNEEIDRVVYGEH